jgi:WD40 repeat protein
MDRFISSIVFFLQGQVLRVLDYSRSSRHILATAGDDGSVHLWDTTARTPKVPIFTGNLLL